MTSWRKPRRCVTMIGSKHTIADFGGESEGQDYHIHFAKLPEEGEDVIVWGDVHIPTSKRGWREQASRELEAEMKHD